MAEIAFQSVTRNFAATTAVAAVSFTVPSGAFFALVGPSGCGKTTVLRLIAGLERPDAGTISLDGRIVAGAGRFVEPGQRDLGMVFQSYALWPHMTVAGNIAFGLGLRGLSHAEQWARTAEALALVGLEGQADRRPHQLSGGQRQRVALARSLAMRPALILLDEPLANLDAHLRQAMLAEFRRIHRQARTTFVFVTHDQNEAMALADLVAVMDRGRMQQIAPPQELFARPASAMVARFVGQGRTVPVEVLGTEGGLVRVRLMGRDLVLPGAAPAGPGWLCLRARDLTLEPAPGQPRLAGRVSDLRFEGGDYMLSVDLEGSGADLVEVPSMVPVAPGAEVSVGLSGGWVLPREGLAREGLAPMALQPAYEVA
ncbi:ABC transporter ATP-binding protein [Frigidibacter mobilis]|uniref:ABC transporter protein n=1 Tax=Frigidibacter mobilis TaxID=1335048 RepID=A0A165SM13_9RHOB|nr:ABC transporter ATP-binding protein [Frigidibacter mobilis]AMY69319.1 ABC transporter protein [Frigidibacter mobilis]